MLANQVQLRHHQSEQPVLVFLHGLLGSGADWRPVLNALDHDWMTIDLPFHGGSRALECVDFASCVNRVVDTIQAMLSEQTPIILIGYSLGARVAMVAAASGALDKLNVQGLILEGGNFGLLSTEDKAQRWQNDQGWAERFAGEPIEQVLADWYQQPVFSSLNNEQRQTLITVRSDNLGGQIAKMLRATSLAKQPYLLSDLKSLTLPMHYICGERDTKFRQLAQQSGLVFSQVANAGHNVHKEQPIAFAQIIEEFILQHFFIRQRHVDQNNNGNHHG